MDFECCEKLYKGFVKAKGKKVVEEYKDVPKEQLRTLEQALQLESFAGVLADDVILVDFDDSASSDLAMDIIEDLQINCWVYQTTKGRHFLFKNNGVKKNATKTKLACGLVADIKIGCNHGMQFLKVDGVERFNEWSCEYEEVAELPKWLYPIKSSINLQELDEGDGRNDALYRYILDLSRYGFSRDDSRSVLEIVNKYIFEKPLPSRELDTIMRDEAFPEHSFFQGSQFQHDEFAEFVLANDHVKRINGQPHIYDGSVYIPGYRAIESRMIHYLPKLKSQQRTEVMKYLEILCPLNVEESGVNLIAFSNGIYDIKTDQLLDFTPDIILTNKIPHNYNPAAYNKLLDDTLNKLACGDESIRALLEEAVGYSFYRRNELSKSFIFLGDKANGKSTFLTIMQKCIGDSNYTTLDLEELDDRFSTAMMSGKLANIGDDIGDGFLQGKAVAMFKKIVSGNAIKAEYKGQDAFVFKPFVKLFFSSNNLARMKDPTGAVLRRLVIIPMNATFTKDDDDYDPYIISKLTTENSMEYLIQIAVKGLKRVLDNNAFTSSMAVDEQLKLYEEENNTVIGFVNEYGKDCLFRDTVPTIYRAYAVYCEESGSKAESRVNFSKKVCKTYKLTTKTKKIDGKVYRIFDEQQVTLG